MKMRKMKPFLSKKMLILATLPLTFLVGCGIQGPQAEKHGTPASVTSSQEPKKLSWEEMNRIAIEEFKHAKPYEGNHKDASCYEQRLQQDKKTGQ